VSKEKCNYLLITYGRFRGDLGLLSTNFVAASAATSADFGDTL